MYSTIYWLTRLDAIHDLFIAITAIAIILGIFMGVFGFLAANDCGIEGTTLKTIRKTFTGCIITSLVGALALVFIPSKNDMLLIYAGGKAYEYVQSDTSLQKIPYKTTEYLKVILDKEIQDVKKELK